MASVSDEIMIAAVRQYWAPENDYYFPEAATNWDTLVNDGNFDAWSRPPRTKTERYTDPVRREATIDPGQSKHRQLRARCLTLTTSEEEVQVQLFPPENHDGTSSYLGHSPGDHVFRLAGDPAKNQFESCLKYEGQIPRSRDQHWHRFDTHLA